MFLKVTSFKNYPVEAPWTPPATIWGGGNGTSQTSRKLNHYYGGTHPYPLIMKPYLCRTGGYEIPPRPKVEGIQGVLSVIFTRL